MRYEFLTPHQHKLFTHFLDGKSNKEIAQLMNMELSNVITTVKKVVDKVCQFYYNVDKYEKLVQNSNLTETEKKVLKLWKIDGRGVKQICKRLNISHKTLSQYKTNVGKKVDIGSIDNANKNYSVFDCPAQYSTPGLGNSYLKIQAEKSS